MAADTNIKIIVEGKWELDYESPEALGIKFNRTVEDFTDLSKRFGEFSYTFALPQTKVNVAAMEFANVKGRRGIFVGTQKTCRVYNNNKLLLDGVIELRKVKTDTFDCAFFSKFTQLVEEINDKDLKDIESDKVGVWNEFEYEDSIIPYINTNNLSVDDAEFPVQFPLVFYSTFWTPFDETPKTGSDDRGRLFTNDDAYQNTKYVLSSNYTSPSVNGTNKTYFHQYPMAVYIIPVLEGLLEDAGWTLGGSFFEREELKRIVMLYTGDNDVYDRAAGCTEDELLQCTGTTSPTKENIRLAAFLPEMGQVDFMKGLMNTFNLYFTLDIDNRIIKFETWDTMFGDTYDPYEITEKVFGETVSFNRVDNYDPSLSFNKNPNQRVLGDNLVMTSNDALAPDVDLEPTEEQYTPQVFNKIGTTGSIKVPFGLPQIGRHLLRQDYDLSGNQENTERDYQVFIPSLTNQTWDNNDNKPFYKKETDTFVQNDEQRIRHKGKPTLMYYYGQSDSDLQDNGFEDNDRYLYTPIGGTPTRTKFGVANPFVLPQGNQLDTVNEQLDGAVPKSRLTAEASYLKGLHFMLGKSTGDVENVPEYSLTFGEDNTLHETLWTKFHKRKYNLYTDSELMECTMRMNDVDWNEMQINRPIRYNDEIYSIISIDNYNVVNRTAEIKLIKK